MLSFTLQERARVELPPLRQRTADLPILVDGLPSRAIGLVPIRFSLAQR